MKTIKPTSRRNFLLAAGLGSAGAVAVVANAGKAKLKTAAAKTPSAAGPDGYRETDHIRKYYKTTEV